MKPANAKPKSQDAPPEVNKKQLTEGQRMARKRRGGINSRKKTGQSGLVNVEAFWRRNVDIARHYDG